MAIDPSTLTTSMRLFRFIRTWTSRYPMHMALVFITLGVQYIFASIPNVEQTKPILTFLSPYLGVMQYWIWPIYGCILSIVLSLIFFRLRRPILGEFCPIEEDEVQERIRKTSKGATSLCIFAGDASFLDQDEEQLQYILNQRSNARILLRRPTSERVLTISRLLENDVAAREYAQEDHNQTIRGRLVTFPNSKKTCLFGRRDTKFEYLETDHLEVSDVFFTHFDRLFNRGRHPLIRAIIFDLAGVAFKGDIKNFYKQIEQIIGKSIPTQNQDYLCVDHDLNLGNCNVIGWLSKKSGIKFSEQQEINISRAWGNTWKQNGEIHAIVQKLGQSGYITAIASNCDKENGDKYRRDQLFVHFSHTFLSYELGLLKPDNAFFDIISKELHLLPCQCLLIDDHEHNTHAAKAYGMHTILVERHRRNNNLAQIIKKELEQLRVDIQ